MFTLKLNIFDIMTYCSIVPPPATEVEITQTWRTLREGGWGGGRGKERGGGGGRGREGEGEGRRGEEGERREGEGGGGRGREGEGGGGRGKERGGEGDREEGYMYTYMIVLMKLSHFSELVV